MISSVEVRSTLLQVNGPMILPWHSAWQLAWLNAKEWIYSINLQGTLIGTVMAT
jgi:hypothetical protein